MAVGSAFVWWWGRAGRTVSAFKPIEPPSIPNNALGWRSDLVSWKGEPVTWR